MAVFEIRKIPAFRCANIAALVSFILYAVLAAMLSPFLLFAVMMVPRLGAPPRGYAPQFGGPGFVLAMLIFYPVIGAVMGWIVGGVGAFAYNLVVRLTGGLQLEFDEPVAAEPVA
jgi:hypothetical protein